ncbi:MAG: prenyltransferase/squalene oxidase repeat-containing protein [Verrucomicrobiota bacterium]
MNSERGYRRRDFLRASALAIPVGGSLPLSAKVEDGFAQEEWLTEEVKRSVDRGLKYLASRQIKTGKERGSFSGGGYSASVGISSLAGLAFMSAGNTPGIGVYGKEVENCANFVVANTGRTGYIARSTGAVGNMYGHGFATLFLSQAYGMSRRKDVGEALRRAVKCIVSSQNDEGGWRYQPVKNPRADLSVTVCQIMALRAARDAGIKVPDATREKCIDYVKRSQNPDGSFRYMLQGGHSTFALTAAGVVSLFSAGIYEGEEVEKALRYLKRNRDSVQGHYFYYGHYYAVQAMWHAGGDWWSDWYPFIRERLVRTQESGSGAWGNSNYGAEFGTSMASVILQMPRDLLPIFAR